MAPWPAHQWWLRVHPRRLAPAAPRNPHILAGCCTELRAGEQGRRHSEGPGQSWVVAVSQEGVDIPDDGPGFQSQLYLCECDLGGCPHHAEPLFPQQ